MRTFLQIARVETRIILRSKVALFWTFAFPILLMVVETKLGGPHTSSFPRIFAGVVAVVVVSTALMGFAAPLVQSREMGTLAGCSTWPISKLKLIAAMAYARVQIIGLAVGLIVVAAYAILQIKLSGDTVAFIGILALGTAALLTFGAALGGRVRQMQTAMALCNLLYFGMIFLGGIFFDPNSSPQYIRFIVSWLPVNALVDAIIDAMTGNLSALFQPIFALSLFLIGSVLFVDRQFDWSIPRKVTKVDNGRFRLTSS